MSDIVRFTNGYLAMPDGTVCSPSHFMCSPSHHLQAVKADLYISSSSGKIISGQSSFYFNHSPCRTVDLQGNLLSPGLIDIQINGAWRVDFSELDVQAGEEGEKKYVQGLERVARRLAQYGTTSFLPTIITQHQELYSKVSPKIFCYMCGY